MTEPDTDSLRTAVDDLFRGPVAEFTRCRNALAKQLKASGQPGEAARIKAMTKPSVSAWVTNQLWWEHRAQIATLLAAGERIRAAAAQAAGPAEQAAAGKARRQALTALSTTAERLLAQGGHAAGAATMRKVATNLQAAAAYGHGLPEDALGRLSGDLDPPGFEMFALAGKASSPTLTLVPPLAAEPSVPPPPAAPPAERAVQRAEQAMLAAETLATEAARTVDRLTREADVATTAAAAGRDAYKAAQDELREATVRADAAEMVTRRADKAALATSTALDRAQVELRKRNAEASQAAERLKQAQADKR